MTKLSDVSKQQFGELTVVTRDLSSIRTKWICLCSCGTTKSIASYSLVSGRTRSCGCKRTPKGIHSHNFKDLVGKTFGELTIVSLSLDHPNKVHWNCRCSCGEYRTVAASSLSSGSVTSCGHLQHRTRQSSPHWKGHGEITGQYWAQLKHGAKSRNLQFQIYIEEVWQLFELQQGRCALTGLTISCTPEMTASVDRIDPGKGYISGNIQWVHKDVNRMKQNFTEDRLFQLCELLVEHKRSLT